MITLQCLQWNHKKISLCFWVVDLEIAFFFQTWKSHSTVIVLVLLRVHAGFISLWWFVPLCFWVVIVLMLLSLFMPGLISLWWFVPLCLPNMTPLSIFNETEWKIIGVCCSHQEHGGQLNRLPAHQMVRGAASIICYKSKHKLLLIQWESPLISFKASTQDKDMYKQCTKWSITSVKRWYLLLCD